MRRVGPLVLGALTFLLVGIFGAWAFSEAYFRLNSTQRRELSRFVPSAQCEEANFNVFENENVRNDFRYVVEITGSDACLNSLRNGLLAVGAKVGDFQDNHGYYVPGHEDQASEAVLFDFDAKPGSVIWIRDKI